MAGTSDPTKPGDSMSILSRAIAPTIACLLCSAAAQATPVVLNGFSIEHFEEAPHWPTDAAGYTILSSAGGVTELALDNLRLLSSIAAGGAYPDIGQYGLDLSLVAQAGYKITGYALSGTLSGTLEVGQVPSGAQYQLAWQGSASNHARFYFHSVNGASHTDPTLALDDINGGQDFRLGDRFSTGSDGLTLTLESLVSGTASYTRYIDLDSGWDDNRAPSLATLRIDHPVLTIYTAPLAAVPEPQAWMLLLLGLAPLALARYASGRAANAARPEA